MTGSRGRREAVTYLCGTAARTAEKRDYPERGDSGSHHKC